MYFFDIYRSPGCPQVVRRDSLRMTISLISLRGLRDVRAVDENIEQPYVSRHPLTASLSLSRSVSDFLGVGIGSPLIIGLGSIILRCPDAIINSSIGIGCALLSSIAQARKVIRPSTILNDVEQVLRKDLRSSADQVVEILFIVLGLFIGENIVRVCNSDILFCSC